jgi:hypothetical protein
MEMMSAKEFKLLEIFEPGSAKKRLELLQTGRKLVHYTSADTALKIVRSRRVWMRNVRCMNDFMEVEHGFNMMMRFFQPPSELEPDVGRTDLLAALEEVSPGMAATILHNFSTWMPTIRSDSYVTCISEHHQKEDENGRLSMWRSYGMGAVGVGIVINTLPFYSLSDAINAYSSPVTYESHDEFFERLRSTARKVREEREFLSSLPPGEISKSFFNLLLRSALCSKHPGFEEEQEWRIVHIPKLWPSETLERSTEVVAGVPQLVYKIPLNDMPERGLTGIEIAALLDRVIIGPCNNPFVVYQAFEAELKAAGVENAAAKIVPSQIPLRN